MAWVGGAEIPQVTKIKAAQTHVRMHSIAENSLRDFIPRPPKNAANQRKTRQIKKIHGFV
jgi:tRNA A-37 threonylcarbamoyl transferase component Bud32